MKTQTFENDWSRDLSPSPLSFEKSKMEVIDVVFNWYLADLNNVFYTCAVQGW